MQNEMWKLIQLAIPIFSLCVHQMAHGSNCTAGAFLSEGDYYLLMDLTACYRNGTIYYATGNDDFAKIAQGRDTKGCSDGNYVYDFIEDNSTLLSIKRMNATVVLSDCNGEMIALLSTTGSQFAVTDSANTTLGVALANGALETRILDRNGTQIARIMNLRSNGFLKQALVRMLGVNTSRFAQDPRVAVGLAAMMFLDLPTLNATR